MCLFDKAVEGGFISFSEAGRERSGMTGQMPEEPLDPEVASGLLGVAGLFPLLGAQKERAGVEEPVAFELAQKQLAPLGMGAVLVLGEDLEERGCHGRWLPEGETVLQEDQPAEPWAEARPEGLSPRQGIHLLAGAEGFLTQGDEVVLLRPCCPCPDSEGRDEPSLTHHDDVPWPVSGDRNF